MITNNQGILDLASSVIPLINNIWTLGALVAICVVWLLRNRLPSPVDILRTVPPMKRSKIIEINSIPRHRLRGVHVWSLMRGSQLLLGLAIVSALILASLLLFLMNPALAQGATWMPHPTSLSASRDVKLGPRPGEFHKYVSNMDDPAERAQDSLDLARSLNLHTRLAGGVGTQAIEVADLRRSARAAARELEGMYEGDFRYCDYVYKYDRLGCALLAQSMTFDLKSEESVIYAKQAADACRRAVEWIRAAKERFAATPDESLGKTLAWIEKNQLEERNVDHCAFAWSQSEDKEKADQCKAELEALCMTLASDYLTRNRLSR